MDCFRKKYLKHLGTKLCLTDARVQDNLHTDSLNQIPTVWSNGQ